MKAKILLAGLAVVLATAGFELALRALSQNPFAQEDLDHILRIRRQHASTDRMIDRSAIVPDSPRVRFRTDDRGYLRPSQQHADPDVTIAFLGGSTTECSAVKEKLRFPARVSTLLEGQGLAANTLNAGRSGNTAHDSLNLLLNHVVLDEPDVAVLMHATNDVAVIRTRGGYAPRMGEPVRLHHAFRWGLQALSTRLHLAARLREVVTQGGTVEEGDWYEGRDVEGEVAPVVRRFQSRIRAFVHLSRDLGIRPVLMTQALSPRTNELTPGWSDPEWQDHFNDAVRAVAGELDVPLVDLAREVPRRHPRWREPMRIFYDGMHVTDRGAKAYARIIVERLRETVLASARPHPRRDRLSQEPAAPALRERTRHSGSALPAAPYPAGAHRAPQRRLRLHGEGG